MNYGKAIRLARSARGLTQQELADRAGLNSSYISLLEKGHRVPGTKALEALSEALEVPMYLLMLMGSDQEDLRGVPKEKAEALASELLQLVVDFRGTET